MIPIHNLKPGDIVNVDFDGTFTRGSVAEFDRENQQICVITNDDQESWYSPADLSPIILTKEDLEKLQFVPSAPFADGTITYVRGPFSIEVKDPNTLQEITLMYRNEAQRVFHHGLALHELQNHYLDMTNVHLIDRAALED